jgi:hypothetical protein
VRTEGERTGGTGLRLRRTTRRQAIANESRTPRVSFWQSYRGKELLDLCTIVVTGKFADADVTTSSIEPRLILRVNNTWQE